MSTLSQVVAVTTMNLRNVPQRFGTSSVIVLGVAGVVAVLISVLAMSTGFRETIAGGARPDRVMVLSEGATAEIGSTVSRDVVQTIAGAPGIARSPDGQPVLSAEAVATVEAPRRQGGLAHLTLRGVGPQILALRPEVTLVEGRMFRPAVNEVIVGKSARDQFAGVEIGDPFQARGSEWTVVGIFTAGRGSQESEAWTDAETALAALQRKAFQIVALRLAAPEALDELKSYLADQPNLSIEVKRETDYVALRSATISGLLRIIAYYAGGVMAIGAVFGALNTMYSAVSARTQEIATLRAIGFGPGGVLVSVLVETLLLSLLGAAIGTALAWALFNGMTVSTIAGGTMSQVVFPLSVTSGLVWLGIAWALVIGLIGGLFPALRAARLPVAAALMST